MSAPSVPPAAASRVPLWFKLAYTAYLAVLVPAYWISYGPTNFLYFCDVALLLTGVALWLESPLLVSAPAVGILLPQAFWMIDFLVGVFGVKLTGMTEYMFNPEIALFMRGLSFFHFWLPLVLLWLVYRLGYDRRALLTWTLAAWVLLAVCYLWMPAPPTPNQNQPVNINYVYGLSDYQSQTWMPPLAWLGLLLVGLPLAVYLPTHVLLGWACPAAPGATGWPGSAWEPHE
jgi:hypothetical protein